MVGTGHWSNLHSRFPNIMRKAARAWSLQQLHWIAEVLAKNSRAVFQQQRVKRRPDDRFADDKTRTPGLRHRTLLFRQGVQEIREGDPIDVQRAHGVADKVTHTACVL